jgi:hypothetical protein
LSVKRYLTAAQNVAQSIPELLIEQGLKPEINCYFLTETAQGAVWLFVVMDNCVLDFLEAYTEKNVLSHLSAALHGHPVMYSSRDGLRYAVLLSPT